MNIFTLFGKIAIETTDAESDLKRTQEEAEKTEGRFAKVGASAGKMGTAVKAGALVGVAAIAGLGAAALKIAGDFDDAYDKIRIGTGATGDDLEGLKDSFRSVVSSVPTDFDTASTAVADLNTALGITGPQLELQAAQHAELARITGTDVATNIKAVTRAYGDWGVAVEDQSSTLDMFFKVSQATGQGVDQLAGLIVQFGAPMRQFGFSIEETTAMLGKWQKEGVNTELVMGSLRIAGGKFAKENVPLRQGLEETIARIQEMGPSAESTALAMEVFGARAGVDMVDAILNGKFAIEDFVQGIEASEDSIFKVGRETQDWQEKLTLLKNQALIAIEPYVTAFMDKVTDAAVAVGQITEAVIDAIKGGENFEDMISGMSPTMQGITLAIVAVADVILDKLVPAFMGGIETILSVLEPFISFIFDNKPLLIAAITAIGVAILVALGPGAAAVLGIVAFITLLGVLREAIGAAKQFIVDQFNALPGPIQAVFTFIYDYVKTRIEGVLQVITATLDIIKNTVAFWINVFTGDWRGAWDNVKNIVDAGLQLVIGVIKATMGNIPQIILDAGLSIFNAAKNIADNILAGVSGVPGDMLQLGKDIAKGIWDGIASMKDWLFRQVEGFAKGIWDSAKKGLGDLLPGSPSKFGLNIPIGIAEGIDASAHVAYGSVEQMNAEISDLFQQGLIGALAPQNFAEIFEQVRKDIVNGVFDPGAWGDLTPYANRAFKAIMSGVKVPSSSGLVAASSVQDFSHVDQRRLSDFYAPGTPEYFAARQANVSAYFRYGTDYVPHDGIYGLHKGERVMSPEENAAYSSGMQGRSVTIEIKDSTIYARDRADAERAFEDLGISWSLRLNGEGASLP